MNEQRTYKRFDLLAILAILGCIGMLLFECFFIFEAYDRAALQTENPAPARPAPEVKVQAVSAAPAIEKSVAPETNAPPVTNVAPAEIEKAPVRREPVEPVKPAAPLVVPAG